MSIIIEPVNIHGASIVLIHASRTGTTRVHLESLAKRIDELTDSVTKVAVVLDGEPNPNNSVGAYIVRETNQEVMSAINKLAKDGAPGAIIPLTDPEFDAFTDPENVIPV